MKQKFPLVNLAAVNSLSEEQIMDLAHQANLVQYDEKKFLGKVIRRRIKQLDLNAPEVIEAIAQHLVNKPIQEADSIKKEIDADITKLEKHLKELDGIKRRICGEPVEERVEAAYKKMLKEAHDAWYHAYQVAKTDRTKDAEANLLWDEWKRIEKAPEFWKQNIADKMEEEGKLAISPFSELYEKQMEEVERLTEALTTGIAALKEQREETDSKIAPILEIAEDMKDYLSIASDLTKIRAAAKALDDVGERYLNRQFTIDVLAHYSSAALDGLKEVRSNLEARADAKKELIGTINDSDLHNLAVSST